MVDLPVFHVLPKLAEALALRGMAVLQAPPGAGKTTLVPLDLLARGIVAGAVAAFCVTSTVRMASDLGYTVLLPQDALLGFDLPAHDGGRIDAATVQRVTLSILGADFARLTTVDDLAA